jgi:hypothetical protein
LGSVSGQVPFVGVAEVAMAGLDVSFSFGGCASEVSEPPKQPARIAAAVARRMTRAVT